MFHNLLGRIVCDDDSICAFHRNGAYVSCCYPQCIGQCCTVCKYNKLCNGSRLCDAHVYYCTLCWQTTRKLMCQPEWQLKITDLCQRCIDQQFTKIRLVRLRHWLPRELWHKILLLTWQY